MAKILCVFFPTLHKTCATEQLPLVLKRIGRWALRFSPLTNTDLPSEPPCPLPRRFYGIHLDVSGSLRLFGGEQSMLTNLRSTFERHGLSARLVLSPTLGASWALSRYHDVAQLIVSREQIAALLGPLPFAALRLEEKTLAELSDFNISNVGDILALPPRSLLKRFPRELVLRLNQALGVEQELISPLRPANAVTFSRDLDPPLKSHSELQRHIASMFETLVEQEESKGFGLTHATVVLVDIQKRTATFSLSFYRPSQNQPRIEKLLNVYVERLQIADAIANIQLSAYGLPYTAQKRSWLPTNAAESSDDPEFASVLELLATTLPRNGVCLAQPVGSHIPEQSFCYAPFSSGAAAQGKTLVVNTNRPSLLLDPPRPLRVIAMVPDHPPSWIQWKGRGYRIPCAFGPERIAPEWWRGESEVFASRDYFILQLESGVWMWVFRAHDSGHWFMHGIWT